MTTVGFIGSGQIGSAFARLAVEAGQQVVAQQLARIQKRSRTRSWNWGRGRLRRRAGRPRRSETSSWSPCRSRPSLTCPPRHWRERRSSTRATTALNVTGTSLTRQRVAHLERAAVAVHPGRHAREGVQQHLLQAPAVTRSPGGGGRPLVTPDRRGLRGGQGGGDPVHRLHRVQRGGRGTAGR